LHRETREFFYSRASGFVVVSSSIEDEEEFSKSIFKTNAIKKKKKRKTERKPKIIHNTDADKSTSFSFSANITS
jgi:hypothetical protein